MRGSDPLSSASGASAVGEAEARGRGRRRPGTPSGSARLSSGSRTASHTAASAWGALRSSASADQNRRRCGSTAAGSGSPPASRAVDGVADAAAGSAVAAASIASQREGLLLAVVGLEEEVAERERRRCRARRACRPRARGPSTSRSSRRRGRGTRCASTMPHPRVHVEHALALGDLVGVVHPDVVDAAGVDVEAVAEVLGGHGRALDVPAGEAAAPRRVPLLLALHARRGELPEREVGRVALGLDVLDATARGRARRGRGGRTRRSAGTSTRRSTRRRR